MDVNQLPDAAAPTVADTVPVPPPAAWQRRTRALWGRSRTHWRRRLGTGAVGLIGLVFAARVVLPIATALLFPTGCTIGDPRCTLVRQWSDTISKLGIEPVFPPEEDLHVGDVFAVLTSIAGHENQDPILSKSVKLAHLDLTPALQEVYRQLPVFPDTPSPLSQAEAAVPDGADIFQGAWPRNRLPLVAFPALTIEHTQSLDGSWGWLGRALGGSASADQVETIELLDTSSYGVPALYATQALESFCRYAAEVCSEDGARRMVSYVVGSDFAFATRADGRPVNEVSLYIVDRVYLARTIRQHRGNQTAEDANGSADATRHASAKATGESSFLLNQTFTRPVVIGYRAIHVQPVIVGRRPAEPAALTLPELLRQAVESAGLITAPRPLLQDKPEGAALPPAPAGVADGCVGSGLSALLCGSLHPTLRAPTYGNTQAISPEARQSFESQQVPAPGGADTPGTHRPP
jgi:hypothetical protein